MATPPVTPKTGGPLSAGKKTAFDLAAALGRAGPLTTAADLATALQSGLSAGVLADAILSRQPGTENVSAELATALADTLKADKGHKKSKVSTERIDKLGKLAESLTPPPLPPVTDVVTEAAAVPTENQKEVAARQELESQRDLSKLAARKSMFGEVVEPEAPAEAPKPAAPDTLPVPEAALKLIAEAGEAVSGTEMKAILAALAQAGIPPESVADQLIARKGTVAEKFSVGVPPKKGQSELTLDSVGALQEALWATGLPEKPTPEQRAVYEGRLNDVALLSTKLTAVDAASPPGVLRGKNGDAKITADLLNGATKAVGRDGILTEQGYRGLKGPLREAADFLRKAIPGVAINAPTLAMAAAQLAAGLPQVMGVPYPLPANYVPGGPGNDLVSQMLASMMNGAGWNGGMPPGGIGTYMPWAAAWNPSNIFGSNEMTANRTVLEAGFIPTGNTLFDLSNAIANAKTFSPTEMALLSKIKDPEQRAIQELQMQMQKQALLATVVTNLANMRHEMLKAVANNLRG